VVFFVGMLSAPLRNTLSASITADFAILRPNRLTPWAIKRSNHMGGAFLDADQDIDSDPIYFYNRQPM
jgi:hypothetical protein